ncbi:MAG TPA: universal stress protein [Thermodesulfobacteriota bacterium]
MRILHPTDFSQGADRARALAVAMARSLSAEIVLLHVIGPMATLSEELPTTASLERIRKARQAWAEAEMERRVLEVRAAGVPARGLVRVGEPPAEIVQAAADEGADLIVMGTAGLGGVGRFLVGSVADRVIRRAGCPVVTTRADSRTGLTA